MLQKTQTVPKPKILIVEPFGGQYIQQIHQLRLLFNKNGWEVRKIEPYDRIYNPRAVLLIPDTGGLNCNMEYMLEMANTPPQDNGIEYFRTHTLHYYVKKNIPILGLGTSAYLTFAEVCSGKLLFGNDGLSCGASKKKTDVYNDHFVGPNCGGLFQFGLNEDLVLFAESLLPRNSPTGGVNEMALVI